MTSSASIASARSRIGVIAGMAWLEARRTRLPWFAAGTAGVLLLASWFGSSLTITEGTRAQTAFLAAGCRMAAIFVVCLHTVGSQVREAQDRGTELLLSLDLSRAHYLAGRAIGLMVVAAAVCAVFSVPVVIVAPGGAAFAWLASLILESWIVVAACLFSAVTMAGVLPAAAFALGLYVLARSIGAVVLIATASPFVTPGWSDRVPGVLARGLSLLLPDLARFTRVEWLVETPPGIADLAAIGGQGLACIAVLLAAAAFDLYRKNT
jgi:Cu-processing system permease protein